MVSNILLWHLRIPTGNIMTFEIKNKLHVYISFYALRKRLCMWLKNYKSGTNSHSVHYIIHYLSNFKTWVVCSLTVCNKLSSFERDAPKEGITCFKPFFHAVVFIWFGKHFCSNVIIIDTAVEAPGMNSCCAAHLQRIAGT